jgi:putative endonuclease
MNKREQGGHYETMAAEYLKNKGYEIILQNFFSKNGEIDIIAKDTDTLVFCEVKYRSNTRYGLPEEAVDYRKQDKIRKTAAYYLYRNNFPVETRVRFDVIAVLGEKITHIEDAF